jgi:serine/threonine protein kinase
MDGFPRRFGGYVLVKPLARGGMGALYLAVHGQRGLEKLCVVKTALPHLAGRSYVQRFKDEAKVVVRLSHGNLVGVFDAGQVHGEIYLAMEFVEGKDLRAVWNRCAQKGIAFPLPVAAHIVKELMRGLAYAHGFEGLRLVHRDVSPPNVLLSYSGEVKLTDFGLATSTLKLEKTAPGVIFGKVSYMAPEQARAETLDGRTDIYSAGVILWELLTGRQLFAAGARPAGAAPGDHAPFEARHSRSARTGCNRHEGARGAARGPLSDRRGVTLGSGRLPGQNCPCHGRASGRALHARAVRGHHCPRAGRAAGSHS